MWNQEILNNLISIAITAGEEILKIYALGKKLDIKIKKDKSLQIEADLISHRVISEGLKRLNFNFPILSEEEVKPIDLLTRQSWDIYWLIDPLDGTYEFIHHKDQFTVNIALIEKRKPVLGVVYVPVTGICYYAAHNLGAFKRDKNGIDHIISTRKNFTNEVIITMSNREASPQLDLILNSIGPHTIMRLGSSLKFCLIAEGKADLYPRLFPTYEWDTAAAHCILLEAGGDIYDIKTKNTLQYNKTTMLNDNFLALSEANKKWLKLL